MLDHSLDPPRQRRALSRNRAILVALVGLAALLAFVTARLVGSGGSSSSSAVASVPTNPAMEAAYGVRMTRIAVTGDGGLLDLRFIVLDPVKAQPVLGHHGQLHILVRDEKSNRILDTRTMTPGDSNLQPGTGYYVIFRNAAGTVKPGSKVDIIIGDLHVDGMKAL